MSSENWVVVYSTTEFHKAQLLKGMLEENDIVSIIINYGDSMRLFPDASNLFVNNNDSFKAAYLINKIEEDGYEV